MAPNIRYNAYQSWSTAITSTLASGATFTPLAVVPCDEVTVYNPVSGQKLDIKSANAPDTDYVTIDAPAGAVIPVAGYASEIMVRRNDLSNTPVTVRYIYRKFRR